MLLNVNTKYTVVPPYLADAAAKASGRARTQSGSANSAAEKLTGANIYRQVPSFLESASPSQAALAYARLGWRILPVHPHGAKAKAPLIRGGFHSATSDLDTVEGWWKKHPDALIGYVPDQDIVVLDIDSSAALVALESINGAPLPPTLTVRTGRRGGGWHLYYTTTRPDLMQTVVRDVSDRRIVRGVDVKVGAKGYLILPPSPHPKTCVAYVWEHVVPLAPLPLALETACRPALDPPSRGQGVPPAQGDGAVKGLVRAVQTAPEGKRNNILFWAACKMDEHERQGEAFNWEVLARAAEAAGLSAREVAATIESARRNRHGR